MEHLFDQVESLAKVVGLDKLLRLIEKGLFLLLRDTRRRCRRLRECIRSRCQCAGACERGVRQELRAAARHVRHVRMEQGSGWYSRSNWIWECSAPCWGSRWEFTDENKGELWLPIELWALLLAESLEKIGMQVS